jgi:hypothetical protein
MQTSADILVLLEACSAAGAALSVQNQKKREGRMEVIAACPYPGVTLLGGPESFNTALSAALAENAAKRTPFTTATLYHDILLRVSQRLYAKDIQPPETHYPLRYRLSGANQKPSHPIHLNLTGDMQLPLIKLTPLRLQPQPRLYRQPRQYGDPDMNDVGLDWDLFEDEEEFRRFLDRLDRDWLF